MSSVEQMVQKQTQDALRENQMLRESIKAFEKEARKALRETGLWNQQFDGQEIVSVIAIFVATRKVIFQKDSALDIAQRFIEEIKTDESVAVLDQITRELTLI